MFDTIIEHLKEQINQFEKEGKSKEEIYLGVSMLNDDAKAALQKLGWKAIYVEQGIFQLNKL